MLEPVPDDGRVETGRVRLDYQCSIAIDRGHCGFELVRFERAGARGSSVELVANAYDPRDPYECLGGES